MVFYSFLSVCYCWVFQRSKFNRWFGWISDSACYISCRLFWFYKLCIRKYYFCRLFNNSLESFEKVNQAITSSRDSVTVNIQNQNGTNSRVTIPSFGFLKNSVDRLQTNINTITNLTGADSSIRLPDGTFRKLVLAKLPTEAADIAAMNSVNEFNVKPNHLSFSATRDLILAHLKEDQFHSPY